MNETPKKSTQIEARTKEAIFAAMHRELRAWNRQIPESPDRLDPVLRLLLQLYASQLAQIDSRLDMVWDVARASLIRSLCPESMRWPVPAFTVMRCQPNDPVVEVDPHTKFFYKEKREGGQTFFFSALTTERLIAAEIRHVYLRVDAAVVDLSPMTGDELMTSTSRPRSAFTTGERYQIYIGIDHQGMPEDFAGAAIFLKGIPDVLKQLRWASWYPGSHFGGVYEDSGFCPGLTSSLEDMFTVNGRPLEWGGLRSSADLFRPLADSFVVLPERFTGTWESGPIDSDLNDLIVANRLNPPPEEESLYWIRLDLPRGGDKAKLQSPFEVYFNCFVAVNKNELTLFKHTGGNRLVEVELPENIDNILEVTSVVDSSGRDYVARHRVGIESAEHYFTPEDRNGKLVLWFDFSSVLELPPDSLTINYAVTNGVSANGIEAGRISDLYESHPGIDSAVNIVPVTGAIPAKSAQQIMTEVSARLRNRDRVLSFAEISRWSRTFDSRITAAECENGVERSPRGVRRCIVVRVTVRSRDFYSDDELKLLQMRLASFLKSRSPVNTQYRVEIIRG